MNGTHPSSIPVHSKPARLRPYQTPNGFCVFLLKAIPILILVLAVERYVGQRFLIGGDDQVDRCLPTSGFT